IAIVVDHEDAPRFLRPRRAHLGSARVGGFVHPRERKARHDLAAAPDALAMRLDASAMHLDQPPHEREPDAEPSLGMHARGPRLGEHLEYLAEHRRLDPDAVVAYADHGLMARALGADPDVPARPRVFRRV